jgi:hypothetical protein
LRRRFGFDANFTTLVRSTRFGAIASWNSVAMTRERIRQLDMDNPIILKGTETNNAMPKA